MDLGLQDRVAFVAGASDGLGLALATTLAREGCRVVISSRSEANLEKAAARLTAAAGVSSDRVLTVRCDVTDEAQIQAALHKTESHFGGLNILVTNAGGPPSGFIDDFDADKWREAMELNLFSTINLCRNALPMLRKAASEADPLGRILMITSVSAKQPIPNLYLSNTARAGVQGFAKSLSFELGPEGITVNTILPGYTLTERLGELSAAIHTQTGKAIPEIEAGWAEANALKRLGQPEEFAAAGAFLCSKPAAYITGIGLVVDGGRTRHVI